jgi:peptidoglycan/xylan/chitin deacetylase (PgdA/CDA1 family)
MSLRVDRLATLYVAQPLIGAGSRQRTAQLPILMYHSISDTAEPGVAAYYRTVTPPNVFKSQMNALREAGWRGVTLRQGLKTLANSAGQSYKTVAITFDDGFEDFYSAAYPVLQDNRFTATMYLPTAYIGDTGQSFKEHRCLTWARVRELHQAGIEFGSHTVNHLKLWDLGWNEITVELRQSKQIIEDKLGATTGSFAYPYAFPQQDKVFASRFRDELKRAGYSNCVTTMIGRVAESDDLYSLKRLPVNSCDDSALLLAKVDGAYDWLAVAQKVVKSAKTLIHR